MRDFLTNRFLNYFRQERFHIFVVYKFKSSSMNLRDIPNIPSIISPKMLNSDNAGEENSKNDLPSPTATRELGNTSAVDGFGFGPAITFDDSIQSIQNQIVGILDDDTENIFVMDEEAKAAELTGLEVRHFTNDFEIKSDEDEEGDVSDDFSSMNIGKHPRAFGSFAPQHQPEHQQHFPPRQRHSGRGPLSRPFSGVTAASLPIDIDRGCAIWNVDLEDYRIRETTREGVMEGQQPPIEEEDGGIRDRSNNKTSSHRSSQNTSGVAENIYHNIQAYSRSIVTTDDPERLFGQRPHRRLAPTESDGPTGHHNDVDEEHDEHHPTSSTAIIAGMGGETTTGEKERRRPTAFARDLNQPAQNPQETDAEERVNQQPKVIIPSSLSSAAVARW